MSNIEPQEKKPTNYLLIIGVVLLVLIGGFFYIQNSRTLTLDIQNSTTPETEIQVDQQINSDTEILGTGEDTKVISVQASSFAFNPKEIRVKKGDTVEIVMTSNDMMHDFVIDEFNVSLPTTSIGETNSVTFVASEVGEFEYYCSVGEHKANGQIGTLIVEE